MAREAPTTRRPRRRDGYKSRIQQEEQRQPQQNQQQQQPFFGRQKWRPDERTGRPDERTQAEQLVEQRQQGAQQRLRGQELSFEGLSGEELGTVTVAPEQRRRQRRWGGRDAGRGRGRGGGGVMPVVTAVVGAAAGVVGGVILGRKGKAPKKVLGVKVPGTGGAGFDGLADNVGNAAKQLGKLASEVREARQRAEKVGKALS